jgi:hypothetical protein
VQARGVDPADAQKLDADILLEPELGGITLLDFPAMAGAVPIDPAGAGGARGRDPPDAPHQRRATPQPQAARGAQGDGFS